MEPAEAMRETVPDLRFRSTLGHRHSGGSLSLAAPSAHSATGVLQLQRTVGNRAVAELMAARPSSSSRLIPTLQRSCGEGCGCTLRSAAKREPELDRAATNASSAVAEDGAVACDASSLDSPLPASTLTAAGSDGAVSPSGGDTTDAGTGSQDTSGGATGLDGGTSGGDAGLVSAAQSARASNLNQAKDLLNAMIAAPAGTWTATYPAQVTIVGNWIHAQPTDADYVASLTKARDLIVRNAALTATTISRTGATCVAHPAHAWSYVGDPSKGIQLCNMWFDSDSAACRTDVLTHETNHLIGLHQEGTARASATTPADAFDNADTMAQFVSAMDGKSTDNC